MLESNTLLMDSDSNNKKSNKIREIVRLQQILKKWKKLANSSSSSKNNSISSTNTSSSSSSSSSTGGGGSSSSKSIKFLKRTLSFSDSNPTAEPAVPKGFLAVCVGQELKRFIIPTEYLVHQAFVMLLQQAEEEFGFQQQGVLKIPCEVPVFMKILKVVEDKRQVFSLHDDHFYNTTHACTTSSSSSSTSSDCELTPSHHPQLCR